MRRQELADAAETYIDDCIDAHGAPNLGSAALDAVIAEAKGRFLGVGAEQYQISETEQSFERSTIGTMLVGMSEELVDQVNYAAMIDILIGRRFDAMIAGGTLSPEQYRVSGALLELQRDLGEMANAAVCASALMRRHLQVLVELGEYAPRSESDYVSQLAAECAEVGAPMHGASGRSGAEIEAHFDKRPTPDTPAGLDAIEAACKRKTIGGEYGDGLDFVEAELEIARMDDDGAGD